MRMRFWSFLQPLLLLGAITAALSVSTSVHASPYLVLDLGTLGGADSATGKYGGTLNNAGQVVGYSTTSNGTTQGFRTLPNTPMSSSSNLQGGTGRANGINASGQAVGEAAGGAFRT